MKPVDVDEFYVGYAPPMPPRLARFVTRAIILVGAGVVVGGAVLAFGHRPLEGGTFAFGERYAVSGRITEHPYPSIDVEGSEPGAGPRMLLVAPGKHGAGVLVRGLAGVDVRLEGARIQRDGRTMLEVVPDSIVRIAGGAIASTNRAEQTEKLITARGEIVDSKCFLGVMVPGAGTTHRACASLCLRGGIPPALFVRGSDGQSRLFLLETDRGEPIGPRASELAGVEVTITGRPGQRGGWQTLRSDPATWSRATASPPAR